MSPSPLSRLWAHAKAALQRLCASLMPLDTLLAREARDLRATLGALEAFCRRIALTEALKLARALVVRLRSRQPRPASKRVAKQLPRLRLWPLFKRSAARVRQLGRATSVREIWREQRRIALIAQLKRAQRKPEHTRLADRIDALQRLLDAPRAATARFARKLRLAPKLARQLAASRLRASTLLTPDMLDQCEALCWSAITDSS